MTTWTLRAFPLALVLALGACDNESKDNNGETDTETSGGETDTTKHTGDSGNPGFEPTSFSYTMEFAIGEDGLPSDLGTGDQAIGPVFTIVTEDDGGDTCTFYYMIDKGQFAAVGQGLDTDTTSGDPEVLEWLGAHGAQWGFEISEGHYEAAVSTSPDERCADFSVDYVNNVLLDGGTYTDLATAVLELGGTNPMFVGANITPSQDILDALDGSGIDADQVLGGYQSFPFEFGTAGGGTTDTTDIFGLWSDLGEDNLPVDDGSGNLALNDAADAFDAETGLPAHGYYRLLGAGIQFSSN
jgi:hypothetical protein